MKPSAKIWMNGRMVPTGQAKIGLFHQGLNYGACVYEGIRCYPTDRGPAVFRLGDHVGRFFYSAAALRMRLGLGRRELTAAVLKTVRSNRLRSGYLRPMAFCDEPKMGINILGARVRTVVLAWPWRENAAAADPTTCLKVVGLRRLDPETVDLKAKIAGYYANGLLGFIEAREAGYSEPLFLDMRGYVAEGAVNNIFVLKGRRLFTPPTGSILAGITRDSIIRSAPDVGLAVAERRFRPEFLREADAVFMTGTGIELKRVVEIDGLYKEPAAAAERLAGLSAHYRAIAQGRVAKYRPWLTLV